MEIQYLKEFSTIAKYCSYVEASNRLYVSESTLFKHVKALEQELGITVFERSGRSIVLTDYGNILLNDANTILLETEQLQRDIKSEQDDISNEVLIMSEYRMTDLLRDFRKKNEKYRVHEIMNTGGKDASAGVEPDLYFMFKVPEGDEYESIVYRKETMAAILPPKHRLAKCTSIHPSDLRNEDYIAILTVTGEPSPEIKACEQAGYYPRVTMRERTGTEVARLVAQGLGVSVLNKKSIACALKNDVAIVDLDPPITRTVYVYWKKGHVLSEGAKALLQFIKLDARYNNK